jgi:hypothetical protein
VFTTYQDWHTKAKSKHKEFGKNLSSDNQTLVVVDTASESFPVTTGPVEG